MITIVFISKSFTENLRKNHRNFNTVEEAIKAVQENDINNSSAFEVLNRSPRRVYLDIENIPNDQPELVYSIIEKFNKLLDIVPITYVLTKNENSVHAGLSYHYIAPFYIDHSNLKRYVHWFKIKHPEYKNYIDSVVYDINRLFRLPNQFRPIGDGLNTDDFHTIVKGRFEDSFIQDTEKLIPVVLNPELGTIKIKTVKSKTQKDDIKEILADGLNKIAETTKKSTEEMSKHFASLIELNKRKNNDENTHENIDENIDDFTKMFNKLDKLTELMTQMISMMKH